MPIVSIDTKRALEEEETQWAEMVETMQLADRPDLSTIKAIWVNGYRSGQLAAWKRLTSEVTDV